MDKGGDEHLVALQRLEEALNAVNANAPVAVDLIPSRFGPLHRDNFFRDYLRKIQPLLKQIHTFQPYWPELDRELLNDLAKAVKELHDRLDAFLEMKAKERKVAGIILRGSIFTFDDRMGVISRARNELDSLRVRSLFSLGTTTKDAASQSSSEFPEKRHKEELQARTQAIHLAEELQSHGAQLQVQLKQDRPLMDVKFVVIGVIGPIIDILWLAELVQDPWGSWDWFKILFCIHFLLLGYFTLSEKFTRRASMRSRANLVFAISEHIKQAQGTVSSPEVLDLIEFAARHRNDETYYKTFDLKTEELKALITGTPPSGPTASPAQ